MNLTGTRYITSTDLLLVAADETAWIESSTDPGSPASSMKTFLELEEAAGAGGVGSDEERAYLAVKHVLEVNAKNAEGWVESFGIGVYAIPFTPVDPVAIELMVDWMWHRTQVRHGMYRSPEERLNVERNLINRGRLIGSQTTKLTSNRADTVTSMTEDIWDFGGDPRRT